MKCHQRLKRDDEVGWFIRNMYLKPELLSSSSLSDPAGSSFYTSCSSSHHSTLEWEHLLHNPSRCSDTTMMMMMYNNNFGFTWGEVYILSVFLQSSYLLQQFWLHGIKQQRPLTLWQTHRCLFNNTGLKCYWGVALCSMYCVCVLLPPGAALLLAVHTRACVWWPVDTALCTLLKQTGTVC